MINSLSPGSSIPITSLEDCSTNIFQIAEINGLKWCCFTTTSLYSPTSTQSPTTTGKTHSENADPVLRAYVDCLEANLLCTWRRRPPIASTQAAYDKPIPRPDAQKELWIFWYTSEEPKLVEEFKSRGLNAVTHSESTDVDAPRVEFEYETRTLFFKSLNSAIERRLLTEGFIRFGRWLFRPLILSPLYSRDKRAIPRFMNAIRFHYFLHRDSFVCASIIVQKQPTILLLSQSHLNEQSQGSQPVVLAPWSIRAKLLPNQKALLGDFDKLRNSMLPCPDYEEDPSFLSSTLSPEKNDDDGIALKKRLNQLVQSHWSEWKRIYPSLELLYTNSIGNKSFLNNSSNNKRRASGSVVASSRSNTLTSLPRMVVIQLGGQFLLYPSAFVGIPLDEMIDPFPAKKPGTTTMNEQTCNEILVGNFSDLPENTQCVSTLKSDVRTSKLRRHAYTGLSAARTSFGLGCLRNPKNKISEAELSDPFNYDLQQQRASDFMAEFGYDYMRREFCYCRICPQLGRNLSFPGQSSVPLTQELHKESQSSQHIPYALISNIHHHQPNTSFHRLYGFNEQNNSTSHDYPEQQLNSDFLTESRISCRTRTTRARIGSRNLSTMTPATSHSRWMNSIDTALNLSEECQQKIKTSVINKENWGFLNLMNESTNFITKKSKQQLNVDNFNNQINTSSNSLIETVSESHCDIKPSPSNLQYHQLASIPNACASELERMLLGDDDDDDSEQNKITCPSNEGDPLGLLQRLPHHNLQQNFKWRKRKRKWNCFGSNAKKCKNVNWPKISSLNLLNSAFIEESNVFSNNPYSSLPSMESKITFCIPQSQNSPEIHQTSTVYAQHSQSLLMKLLAKSPSTERLEQYQPNEFLNETQPPQDISQQKNSVVAAVSSVHDVEGLTTTSQQQIIDEHIDEYAVTPPALLDTESTIVINHQQEMNVDQLQDQQQMNINAFNFEREVHSASHSSDLYDTPSTSSKYLSLNQQQHHTSQTTILSPPASNERVESVNTGGVPLMQIFHGDISTTSNSTGICTTQPSYSTMSTATTNAILQESMSKIYPTPPTPAQQFSPQNMLLFSHYHLTHQFQTLAQQPLINAEQTIVSILGYFSEQLNHLPWEEPIYESSNHHKAHTRNFYRNMLTNVDNGHEERLIDCIECASILDSMENHNHHNRQLKRVCCEELKRNTSNFIHKTFPNIGVSIPAMELHALAQRRTKADSQLEHRLQMEEQSRFRNFPIVSSQPQHMQDFRNFGTIFQGNVQPLHSQNEQFFSGSSLSLGPASNQFVPSTSQQQILSRQTSLTNCGQISTQFQKASLTNTLTHMPSTSNPSPTHISNQQQVISNFSGFISPSNIVTHNHSNIKRLQQSSNIPNDFLLNRRLCNSSLITLLIQDTIADLHYDIVFDACPLCCCNSNIRSFELGFYITSPTDILNRCDYLQQKQKQQHPQALSLKQWSGFRIPPVELQKCICGFSAVRHRYLCGQGSGLFQEDIAEALGVIYAPSQRSLLRNFNHNNLSDCKLIDLIRSLVTSRDVASLVRCRLSLVSDSTPEYFLSSVDGFELNALVNGVLRIFGITQEQQRFLLDEESILHPWGYQNANSIGEPRDAECLGIFDEVCEILRDPSFPPLGPCFSSNGRRFDQLTLRTFARIKNAGGVGSNNRTGEEENGRAEPIPQVIALSCTEREPLLLSPTMIRNWEQLELMPIDQPKDVLYLALAPDVNVLVEKCKVFFEELSSAYERRCRLGSHIRLAIKDAPKDAILRVGRSSLPLNFGYQGFNSLQSLFTQFGFDQQTNDPIVQKFISYMECCKQELQELAKFLTVNDAIFERRALLESIFRQQQIVQTTSLATPPDASAMPPPAMPGGNSIFTSNGQLSNAIGEHANSSTIHQHPSPLSTPGFVNQQQSPAGGSGPNSVPNLHGNVGDGSNAALTMLRTPSGIETAEELAKREDKLAKDMREQVDLLLSKEEQAKRLQLPHVLVIYLINPFGQIASIEQQTNDQNISELFTDFSERFETLANAAFMRAWNDFLSLLSCKRRSQVQLELLPLRKIYDYCTVMGLGGSEQQWDAGWRTSSLDELRRMAFSIYTQPRLLHSTIAQDALSKSMTKFGTAERMKELFLTFGDNMFLLKQNCSPFLLAPERSINFLSNISSNNSSSGSTGISGNIGGISSGQHFLTSSGHKLQLLNSDERILFLAYCLIADGKWLCASVTDERGSLLDTALINLNVPSEDSLPPLEPQKEWRHRERHSQISDALQRLWLFIRSIMLGQEVHHWRLIINRMGKLGHGEFKIWNDLLSKRSLRAYNSSLKNNQSNVDGLPTSASTAFLNNCQACSNSYGWHETPALLSACLVSIEAEPHLRVFGSPSTSFNSLDNQSTGNGGSSNINSTSSNVISSSSNLGSSMNTKSGSSKGTSRHSLLQAQQWAAVQQQLQSSPDDRSLTHIIVFPTILNVSCQQQEDMHGGIDDDVFADFLGNCFSGDGAPDGMELVEDLVFDESARNEEEAPIDNQPMAIGYTITTAPVWPSTSFCRSDISLGSSLSSDCGLSDAFWYNCPPAARYRRLAHLKSSLHINTTNLLQTDDYQQTTGRGNTGAVSNTTAGNTTALTEQLAPNPLDLPNTDDVLRYVLERQNALSWLNLDPVSGSRFSCLPIHMQTIYRLAESFGTIFDFS